MPLFLQIASPWRPSFECCHYVLPAPVVSSVDISQENIFRCASISWFEVVSNWVSHLPFSASATTGLSDYFFPLKDLCYSFLLPFLWGQKAFGKSEKCRFREILLLLRSVYHGLITTGFWGQKFYTLKVCKLWLFLLKEKQRKCIDISYLCSFFVRI